MYNKMNSLFEDMSKYYCFDKKKYNMEDFFGDIKIFQDSFKVHCSFILWHVISMFCCRKYIYNVCATIALKFPYKCYCTSIFGVQIIMFMTISTFIFKTCDHSADIQDCMLKFITIYWNVKSVFCVERAISATSSLHLISWRYMYMFAYGF